VDQSSRDELLIAIGGALLLLLTQDQHLTNTDTVTRLKEALMATARRTQT